VKRSQTVTIYTQISTFKFHFGGETIAVASKPGLPDWDQHLPAAFLIGEKTIISPDSQILFLGSGNGAACILIAKQLINGRIWLHDVSFIANQLSTETLELNEIDNAYVLTDINLPIELVNSFDTVIIEIPKGRKLARRWLAEAFLGLKTGGILYLCGANKEGINPIVEDAEMLLGESAVLGYKKGSRLVRLQKKYPSLPVEGWWRTPGIAPETWHIFALQTSSGIIEICSLPGIFSFDRLDGGTQLLLDSLPDLHNLNLLDLGCGYGAIGLTTARFGAASVDMVDANLLAVAASKRNIERQRLANARALASDVLSAVPDKKYDLILSNPPFHTGRDVDYQVARAFIEQSYSALQTGGQLYLVANRFIRYERIMGDYFQQSDIIVQSSRFHILRGIK
jgi:16S rRNA (guanine1207-N2)-methyltransferase